MDKSEQRIEELEKRINLLEKKIEALSLPNNSPHHSTRDEPQQAVHFKSWEELQPREPIEAFAPSTTTEDLSNKVEKSGNWLGIIAIICFVFAAGFIIKLSIDTGWLTPERQIIIAALIGLCLIATGFCLPTVYRQYASLLPAAGIIILYCSVFAGYRFYDLTSFKTALVLTSLVSAFCIWLYWKFSHDIYPVVAIIGSYLSPIILNLNYSSFFTIYYFICCSLAFAIISIWTRSRLISIVAAYLAILTTFVVGVELNQNIMLANSLAVHFIIFSISSYLYSLCNKQQLTENEAWAFFPVLTLFYGLEYYLISGSYPVLAPYLSLLFAVILIGLYFLTKSFFPNQEIKSQGMIYSFASLVFFHSFYLEIIPTEFKPWLFVLITSAFAFLPMLSLDSQHKRVFYIPAIMLVLIAFLEYGHIMMQLFFNKYSTSTLFAAWAGFASLCFALSRHYDDVYKKEEYGILFLALAHFLAIMSFYRLADPYGSLAVTSFWLLYAILILMISYHLKDKLMAHSALLVLGLSAGKALLYDAAMTPTAVRIFCLLFTGMVLYGAGLLMKKIAQWDKQS
ncbi:DUF2339 domain-containing protein [Legionella sp. km772]|uniref:DUF2339 domain-containing protein n=1 Tax=Legionella sp. km772 TaxID=2498111 RepID=UPI000F8F3B8B|nr:DUF2339 domain-containing protein [Legionella sp. km772]RUR08350.1 DUF2339 domain-containing protein [Legionella sp. km772]